MYSKDLKEIFKELDSNEDGLSTKEVNKRLKTNGKNVLVEKRSIPIIIRFLKQFKDMMIIILLIVALLLYIYGRLYSHEYTDTIVILIFY